MSQFAEPVIPDESAAGGLGRDDELRRILLKAEGTCSYPAKLNT